MDVGSQPAALGPLVSGSEKRGLFGVMGGAPELKEAGSCLLSPFALEHQSKYTLSVKRSHLSKVHSHNGKLHKADKPHTVKNLFFPRGILKNNTQL